MKRIITVVLGLMVSSILAAQSFPDAQKQPKLREQRSNQSKFKKWSHRRHVKRGTVYTHPDSSIILQTPVCILADDKYLRNIA